MKYKFIDLDGEHVITDEEIIKIYFDFWSHNMERVGKSDQISHENCIRDFLTIHWAYPTQEEGQDASAVTEDSRSLQDSQVGSTSRGGGSSTE